MKLAEALIKRSDVQKRIKQLKHRLTNNATVQEGLAPVEDPQALLTEAGRAVRELEGLVCRINRTNVMTRFSEEMSLAEAVTCRDMLMVRQLLYADLAEAATVSDSRYSQREIRSLPTVNVAEIRKQADALAKEVRELDMRIQSHNWTVDLVDSQHV